MGDPINGSTSEPATRVNTKDPTYFAIAGGVSVDDDGITRPAAACSIGKLYQDRKKSLYYNGVDGSLQLSMPTYKQRDFDAKMSAGGRFVRPIIIGDLPMAGHVGAGLGAKTTFGGTSAPNVGYLVNINVGATGLGLFGPNSPGFGLTLSANATTDTLEWPQDIGRVGLTGLALLTVTGLL